MIFALFGCGKGDAQSTDAPSNSASTPADSNPTDPSGSSNPTTPSGSNDPDPTVSDPTNPPDSDPSTPYDILYEYIVENGEATDGAWVYTYSGAITMNYVLTMTADSDGGIRWNGGYEGGNFSLELELLENSQAHHVTLTYLSYKASATVLDTKGSISDFTHTAPDRHTQTMRSFMDSNLPSMLLYAEQALEPVGLSLTDFLPTPSEVEPTPTTVSVPQIVSMTTTRYSAGAVTSENVSQYTYDGDVATLCVYNGDFLSTRNTYNYKTNSPIAYANFFTDGKANYYEYDSYGTQVSSKSYQNDALTDSKTTDATYTDGKIMEKKTYYADGRLMSHFTYEYDSNGNPTAYIEYSTYQEGVESGRTTFIYDDQDRKIEQINVTYSIDSELHYYFTYNDAGNETQRICYDDGVETSRTDTTYDDQGRIHEVYTYYEGALRSRGVHLYDDHGYRIGYESYNANGELVIKTAITYQMIDVLEEEAEGITAFYDQMSRRT